MEKRKQSSLKENVNFRLEFKSMGPTDMTTMTYTWDKKEGKQK